MLMDHQWHHVAGTYDGKRMTVYLDGLVIGSQARSGRIFSGGSAAAFIGSSGGTGEYFQGGIDDLRVFKVGLPAGAIARLYEEGLSAVLGEVSDYRQRAEAMYEERESFAQTMAATRRNLIRETPPEPCVRFVQSKLATRFPDAYAEFLEITGS